MGQIITYLTFNGNCRQAMEFYHRCLGGELYFQTLGDSPRPETLPMHMSEFILHASLKKEKLVLMGSDMVDEELLRGNSVSIFLDCDDEKLIRHYYQNLVIGGKATHPLDQTHWGDLFGGLTDKYGNNWLFHCKHDDQSITKENERYKVQNSR